MRPLSEAVTRRHRNQLAASACSAAGGGASRRRARTAIATLGPLVSVLLFLAAIISAFWYLRNEEFERETGIGQARHRDRAAADPPAPDREPGAAGPHRARDRDRASIDPDGLHRAGRELHARAPRDHQPDLGRTPSARARPATRPPASRPRPASASTARRRRCRSGGKRQRARSRRSPPRATCASRSIRAPSPTPTATPVFQVHVPLIDRSNVRRRADRRVFDRAPAALLRAGRGRRNRHAIALLDAQERALASTVIADARARRAERASIVHDVPVAPARQRADAARPGLSHLDRPDRQHAVLDGGRAVGC